jgi:multiple sugar transport system substrate-binding protein
MTLRGICWDHERCVAPMRAAAAAWRLRTGDAFTWDARPLAAFNDQPLDELTGSYDLLVIDHPLVGTAARSGALAALDELLDAATLGVLDGGAVGGSHASYRYGGRQWALAADAACQVSAAREDLLSARGEAIPESWDEVLALAERAPGAVAIPLYPSDAVCSLLTLCAVMGRPLSGAPGGAGFAAEAVAALVALAARVDAICFEENPPALLARMRSGERAAYAPLTFGYSGLAAPADGLPGLRFGDVPAFAGGRAGALLGGAGLAVSAQSPVRAAAAAFAAWVCGPEAQRDVVGPSGGQPAQALAWDDAALDARYGRFYSRTRATIDAAHVRPREPWYPDFQHRAGRRLAADLRAGCDAAAITAGLNALLAECRDTDPRPEEEQR